MMPILSKQTNGRVSLLMSELPSGKDSSMLRQASASPCRPQVVMVECSEAGMEKAATGQW